MLRACAVSLLLLLAACATAPVPLSMPPQQRRRPVTPRAQPVRAPAAPAREPSKIGKVDLDEARALIARARRELEPRQWELLDRKLSEAERAWRRFDALSRSQARKAEVSRAEVVPVAGLVAAGEEAGAVVEAASISPLLVALVGLWPSSTAGPEDDELPPVLVAQLEYEAALRAVSEAAQEVLVHIAAGKNPPTGPAPPKERPECRAIPVPHLGSDAIHDMCADTVPPNRFPGHDVLVNGKRFDALAVGAWILWEIKTDRFETYTPFLQKRVVDRQVEELKRERDLAHACGYDFIVGVSSSAHREALHKKEPLLEIVVTGC